MGFLRLVLYERDGVRSWKGYFDEEKLVPVLKEVTVNPNLYDAI